MDMVCTNMLTVRHTKVCTVKTCNMERAKRFWLIPAMKVSMLMLRNKVLGAALLTMAHSTQANGNLTR
jgi:hypothetical protein